MKKILESFETPNQRKMWIDHVTTIHDATKTDTKIDNIDLKDLTQFDFKLDVQTNTVSFTEGIYDVCGQYDAHLNQRKAQEKIHDEVLKGF